MRMIPTELDILHLWQRSSILDALQRRMMDSNQIHVLLIDDDDDFVAVVKHQLDSFGVRPFHFSRVSNSTDALRYITSGTRTDLIVMDYYLPATNGIAITKQIQEAGFSIPTILLTSSKDFRIVIEAMKFGIEEYLVKEELKDTILPRTIMSVLERVTLRAHLHGAEKEKLLSQKKEEAIQELIVTMCHEFNNPLAAIKISADILSRQKISDDDRKLVQRLNTSISKLEKQIIHLRDMNVASSPTMAQPASSSSPS